MKKSILLSLIILNMHLILCPVANASPAKLQNETRPVDSVYHYGMHVLTNGLMSIPMVTVIGVGFGSGMALMAVDQNLVTGSLAASSALTGLIASLYMFYKTPQWTDKYCLDYETERSTKQNIISFLCRSFIPPFPLGVLCGEFLTHPNEIQQ